MSFYDQSLSGMRCALFVNFPLNDVSWVVLLSVAHFMFYFIYIAFTHELQTQRAAVVTIGSQNEYFLFDSKTCVKGPLLKRP